MTDDLEEKKLIGSVFTALATIIGRHKQDGKLSGSIQCPGCKGTLHFKGVPHRKTIRWRGQCTTPLCVSFIQ